MKKFTSFMLMLLCAVTTWGQDVFTNDNLKEITPGNYYIYYTDANDVKHYLQTTGENAFSIVTENPAYYNISVGSGSAFNKAYYIQMNGLCFSNPNPNNNHTLTTGRTGWNAAPYISTVVFENGDGLCALRSTNAPVSTWDENYFITHDENNNVTAIEGSVGGADLFVWTIEKAITDFTVLNNAIEAANNTLADAGYSFTVGDAVPLQVDDANTAGYLSVSHPAIDEDVLANAIDTDPSTLYHSNWNMGAHTPYMQVDLGDGVSVNAFQLNYTTRQSGNNACPFTIVVAGSNDGQTFTTITEVSKYDGINALPTTNGPKYSNIFATDEAYRYLRFTVTDAYNSNNSFGVATFGINKVTLTGEQTGIKMRYATIYNAVLEATSVANNANATQETVDAMAAYLNKVVSIATATYPFELTTDINAPKCYLIKSARSMSENGQWGVPSYWQYRNTGDDANKFTIEKYDSDDAAAQDVNAYWFFMEEKNTGLIRMYPYSNAVAMGYTTVGDGASKLTNNHESTNFIGYTYQLLTNNDTDAYEPYPYALQPYGYNTYVSNHGGYEKMMGFYNGLKDGGTRFGVVKAITPSKKLALLSEKIEEAQACTAGENIGDHSAEDIAALAELIATATTVANDLTSSDEACQAQIDALTNAMAYNIILPADGGYYKMTSVATNEYCAGAYVYAINTSLQRSEDVTFNHNTLVFDKEIGEVPASIFKFIATSNKNEFKIMSALTGEYVKTFGNGSDQMGSESEAKAVRIARIADGQITLTIPSDGYPMHAQQANAVIVTWEATPGNASTWNLNAVDPTILSHDLTIGDAEYATLKLGFNTEIPENVTCYTVSGINENGKATLKEIEGVLPANTAVIVNAAKGTYTFKYTSESGAEGENMLDGTCFTEVITPAANETYYILGAVDGVVGLYKPELDEAEGTAFENQPNKAYLVISTGSEAIQYFSFDFGGGTTGIEGVEAEGAVNGKIYDITGREVKAITASGIYIVNGAKVVVK